jgi:hypothetical protein
VSAAQRTDSEVTAHGEAAVALRITRRVELPLTKLAPVEGTWQVEADVTIRGRVFASAGTMDPHRPFGGSKRVRVRAVFANKDGYDLFEAWDGFRGGRGDGADTFVVLGDGEELYRSPKLRPK